MNAFLAISAGNVPPATMLHSPLASTHWGPCSAGQPLVGVRTPLPGLQLHLTGRFRSEQKGLIPSIGHCFPRCCGVEHRRDAQSTTFEKWLRRQTKRLAPQAFHSRRNARALRIGHLIESLLALAEMRRRPVRLSASGETAAPWGRSNVGADGEKSQARLRCQRPSVRPPTFWARHDGGST
jgi:hypothetical protein